MMVDAAVRGVFRVVALVVMVALIYHLTTAVLFAGPSSEDSNLDASAEGFGSRINHLGASVWRAGEEKLGWDTQESSPQQEAPEPVEEEVEEDEGHHTYDDTREDGLSEEEAALQEHHDDNSKEKIAIIAEHQDAPKKVVKPKAKKPQTKGTAKEVVLQDLKHYTKINDEDKAQQLIVSVAWNESSWGSSRSISDFLTLLEKSSGLKLPTISLAILTTSPETYDTLISALDAYTLSKYQVLLWTPPPAAASTPKKPSQAEAQAKNILLTRTLETEPHVFVLDAAVSDMEKGTMAKILKHEYNTSGDKSITANTTLVPAETLPLGVITVLTKPSDPQTWLLDPSAAAKKAQKLGLQELVLYTEDTEVVPLGSVGTGAGLIYLRAELVRSGLVFPAFEVEGRGGAVVGLCCLAESVGAGCYGLGGSWSVEVSV